MNFSRCDTFLMVICSVSGLACWRPSLLSLYLSNICSTSFHSFKFISSSFFFIQNLLFSLFQHKQKTSVGTAVESAFIDTFVGPPKTPFVQLFPSHFQCVACPKDCTECESTKSCKVPYTGLLRVCILGVQSFCATIVLILAGTTFRLRRSKVSKF